MVRLLLMLALCIPATPLAAQRSWGIALELGNTRFGGHAKSTASDPETTGHPSATRSWGIRLDRSGRAVGFSLGLLVASSGIEFENDDASAEARNILDLLEIAPEVYFVLFRPREAAVRLHTGVILDRWSPEGDNSRTSLGGLGAVSLDVPFSSRLGAQVRWQLTMTGSVFDEDDLPAEFSRKSGWSERWVFGVRLGL